MLDSSSNTCGALLPDGQTRCSVPLRSSKLICAAHAPAYGASYQRYKAAERKAARLSKFARMPSVAIRRLRSYEIERCQSRVRAYADALAEELKLRRKHGTQFIGTPDAGHSQRLEKLKRQIGYHRDILRVLRARTRSFQRTRTHTPVRRLGSPARVVSRIASPIPRLVQRRAGPKPEEERRASARAEARQRFEEARERQHLVVVEAEEKRQQRAVDEEVFNNDQLEAALLLSRLEQKQYETDAHRVEGGEKDRMQEFSQIDEGCTQREWVDEAIVVTANSLPEERLPEDSSKEAGGHIDTSGSCDDTASDSTSDASLDDLKFPKQQSHESLCIFIHVDEGCHLPNSTSSVIKADDTTQSTELSIKSEQGAGSEDSTITTFNSESAPSPETTWAGDLHDSPPAVRLDEATVLCMEDGSCNHVPLEETQVPRRTPSDQDCRDATEDGGRLADRGGLAGGSNGRRPREGEGRGRRYLRCLGLAVPHVIALLVIGRMCRRKSFVKLWKLFRRIVYVGARRILY